MSTETQEITLRVLACPDDGTVLEPRVHSNGDGTIRCPTCKRNHEMYEVDQA